MLKIERLQHYDALIFDMDGTIVDSGPAHEIAWRRALEEFDLPIISTLMRSLCGVPTLETFSTIAEKTNTPLKADLETMEAFRASIFAELIPQHISLSPVIAVAQHYYGEKPLAVGTGANTAEATSILSACGVDHLFDAIIGADQVAKPKPAPDVFLQCAKAINTPAAQCAVFEDAVLGLEAAKAAKMDAYDVYQHFGFENNYFLHNESGPT